jgi:hypothetical protein
MTGRGASWESRCELRKFGYQTDGATDCSRTTTVLLATRLFPSFEERAKHHKAKAMIERGARWKSRCAIKEIFDWEKVMLLTVEHGSVGEGKFDVSSLKIVRSEREVVSLSTWQEFEIRREERGKFDMASFFLPISRNARGKDMLMRLVLWMLLKLLR